MLGKIFAICASSMLVACVLSTEAFAADPTLHRIHSQLLEMRTKRALHPLHVFNYEGDDARDRGATPILMDVKHELLDWIEAKLRNFRRGDDPASLAKSLNAALDAADLTCTSPKEPTRCMSGDSGFDATGYLSGISIDMQQYSVMYSEKAADHEGEAQAVFVVKTGAGILCGTDESAYVYEWNDHRFQRVLDDEQVIALGKPYTPQYIDAVHVTPVSDKPKTRNVLVLGHQGWCSSTWYDTYHRIWRTASNGKPASLLLSNATWSWLDSEPPIEGSINSKEALVEFRVGSVDAGVHSYETIRHYALDGLQPHRIEPIALGPRAFTEEWLKADWKGARDWSDPSSLSALQDWHEKLHAGLLFGEFTDTTHCSASVDLWQIGINFTEEDRKINDKQKYVGLVYFTVRWRPPYRFQMVAVRTTPFASCGEVDEDADADRTLFPIQEWLGWK